jgi:hypothetical protein
MKTNILSLNEKKEKYSPRLMLQDFSSKLPWNSWTRRSGKIIGNGDRHWTQLRELHVKTMAKPMHRMVPWIHNSSGPFRQAIYAE